jgi:hypothetical protein
MKQPLAVLENFERFETLQGRCDWIANRHQFASVDFVIEQIFRMVLADVSHADDPEPDCVHNRVIAPIHSIETNMRESSKRPSVQAPEKSQIPKA